MGENYTLFASGKKACDAVAMDEKTIEHHRVKRGDSFFNEITLEWAHGRCSWLALSAHRRWGFPLIGFLDEEGNIRHVACRTPTGLFDAYGLSTEKQLKDSFEALSGCTLTMNASELSEQDVLDAFMLDADDPEIDDALFVCERIIEYLHLNIGEQDYVSINDVRGRKLRKN